jgi:hypothetical protein
VVPTLSQLSPLQQATLCEQVWPALLHVVPPVAQVPAVWPAGMLQDKPAQHSPLEAQAEPAGWQTVIGGAQAPIEQMPEQHIVPAVHIVPFGAQVGAASGCVAVPPSPPSVPPPSLWP